MLSRCWFLLSHCLVKNVNMTKAGNLANLSLDHLITCKLALSHSLTLDMLNNFCFHVYAQNLLSHFLTLTVTISLSHSFNLSFNHSRHAEQVLFSSLCSKFAVNRRKLQWVFFDLTLSGEFWVHRAGSQLKILTTNNCQADSLFLPSYQAKIDRQLPGDN